MSKPRRAPNPVLVALAALCASLEGGGVMLVGARTAAWAGSRWKNPYVLSDIQSDGFIFQLDGEWNNENGAHIESGQWVDLIQGLVYTGTCGWEDKAATFDGTQGLKGTIAIGNENNIKHIECVCQATGFNGGSSRQYNQFVFSPDYIKDGRQRTAIWYGYGRINFGMSIVGGVSIPSDENTHSFSFNLENHTMYKDGVATAVSNSSDYWGSSRPSIGVNWNNATGDRLFLRGKIYSIRYFSRSQTKQEIAARYAIDRARFNLT